MTDQRSPEPQVMAKYRTRRETHAIFKTHLLNYHLWGSQMKKKSSQNCTWVAEKPLEIHLSIWRHLWGSLPGGGKRGEQTEAAIAYKRSKQAWSWAACLWSVNTCFPNSWLFYQALHTLSSSEHLHAASAQALQPSLWRSHQTFRFPLKHAPVQDQRWLSKEKCATPSFWLEVPTNFLQWRIKVAGRQTQPVLLPLFFSCIHSRHVPHWHRVH